MEFYVIGQVFGVTYDLISIIDAAKILGYSARYTRRLADEGKLIGTKICGRWFVYPQLITIKPLEDLQETL